MELVSLCKLEPLTDEQRMECRLADRQLVDMSSRNELSHSLHNIERHANQQVLVVWAKFNTEFLGAVGKYDNYLIYLFDLVSITPQLPHIWSIMRSCLCDMMVSPDKTPIKEYLAISFRVLDYLQYLDYRGEELKYETISTDR